MASLQAQEQDMVRTFFNSLSTTIKQNPQLLAAAIPLITASTVPAILMAFGFSAAGPVAGSLAAAWQSSIGNVPAGHLFGLIQSITATGTGVRLAVAGTSLAAATFILITYLCDGEIRAMIDQEFGKLLHGLGWAMAEAGTHINSFINSPQVQGFLANAGKAGDGLWGNVAAGAQGVASSPEVQHVMKELDKAKNEVFKGVLGFFGHR